MKRIDLAPFELQIFAMLAELRSFRAVADHFGLSQPAISRAVSRVEARIGARLFDRTSRSVSLTPQGAALLPIARRVVHDLTSSLDEIAHSLSSMAGHVAVAALPSVASAILPQLFAQLRGEHPAIRLSIADTLLGGVTAAVLQGDVDLGIAVKPTQDMEALVFEPFVSDRFAAVLARDHPLAARAELTWADLAAEPFVAMSTATSVRQFSDLGFTRAGCAVEPAFEVSHLASAGALVRAGLGLTALPELALEAFDVSKMAIRPLLGPVVTRSLRLISRRNRTLSPPASLLRERLLAAGRARGGESDADERED